LNPSVASQRSWIRSWWHDANSPTNRKVEHADFRVTAAPYPLFIEAGEHRLFALYHEADGEARGTVLLLPPFAEEMNMSRRMTYLTGRGLSAHGYSCIALDLAGTGESTGAFADARWEIWQENVRAAEAYLNEKTGHKPILLGLRAGALLAASMLENRSLILWQPVGNGETMLNQFLRIRLAASLTGGGEKETTKDLRALWQAGDCVEVAGYKIHPVLAATIDTLRLAEMAPAPGAKTIWIETGDAERGPTPGSQRIIDAWTECGVDVDVRICPGDPYWTIQETTTAPALIDHTLETLGQL